MYGIQAVVILAKNDNTAYSTTDSVATQLGISQHMLAKVIQQLTDPGIVVSQRGPRGGVVLGRPLAEISLFDLVCAIDGDAVFNECLLGLAGCGVEEPCPVHDMWYDVRTELTDMAKRTTLLTLKDVDRSFAGKKDTRLLKLK